MGEITTFHGHHPEEFRMPFRLTEESGTSYAGERTIFSMSESNGDNIIHFPIERRVNGNPVDATEGGRLVSIPSQNLAEVNPGFTMPQSREELLSQMEAVLGNSVKFARLDPQSPEYHAELLKGAEAVIESQPIIDWKSENQGASNVDEARTQQAIRDVITPEPIDFTRKAHEIQEEKRRETGKYGQFRNLLEADDVDAELENMTHKQRTKLREIVNSVYANPNASLNAIDRALQALLELSSLDGDPELYASEIRDLSARRHRKFAEEQAYQSLEAQGLNRADITPELLEMTIEQMRPMQKIPEVLEAARQKINTTTELKTARDNFAQIRARVRDLQANINEKNLEVSTTTNDLINKVMDLREEELDSVEKVREYTERLMASGSDGINMKQFFVQVENTDRRSRIQIQSLEDLVELISLSQGGEFGIGGKYEVMSERGEVQLHNLVAWIRNRIVASHHTDPDGEINLFNEIRVPTFYGQISLRDIVYIPAYFQKRKVHIEGKEGAAVTMRYENSEDAEYNQIKEDLLYEAWLFSTSHNNDSTYRAARERENDLFNVLSKQYARNEFTKGRDRMLNILRLAKADPTELNDALRKKKQGSVGKAIARGISAYYFMAQLVVEDCKEGEDKNCMRKGQNMFKNVMGEEGMRYLYQSMVEQLLREEYANKINEKFPTTGPTESAEEADSVKRSLQASGRAELARILSEKHSDITEADLAKYDSEDPDQVEEIAMKLLNRLWRFKKEDLNIFDKVDKSDRLTTLVSNAITDATGKLEGLNGDDTAYAGLWAFTMRNWTGIAAKNDTGAIGFDAWSKLINFDDYRVRQASGREGPGNIESLFGVRSLGLTFMDGLMVTTEDGQTKSLIKVIQESVLDKKDIETFDVGGNAQRQFASNHVIRGYQLYEFILDKQELKMDSFLHKDARGYLIFDHVKAQELMGGPYKYMRYCFDQLGFPMDSYIQGWWKEYRTNPVTGKLESELKFGERELKEYFLAPEVHALDLYHDPHYTKKDRLARNMFGYLLAMEMKVHRQWGSTYPRWSIETIEEIEHFFARFSEEPGVISTKTRKEQPIVSRSFFTKHEWDEILKAFDSPYWKMYLHEYLVQASAGLGGAFLKAFLEILKQSVSIPKAA